MKKILSYTYAAAFLLGVAAIYIYLFYVEPLYALSIIVASGAIYLFLLCTAEILFKKEK